jgi:peptidoglycan/xylan/chitin deacetylase (PgdA/CDA1 family)
VSHSSAQIWDRLWRRSRPWPFSLAANGRGGLVSFTFDDFPRSALTEGGAILERHGARGTYYAALGLSGSDGPLGLMFELDDLRRAHAYGHEIGCHTYGHVNCAETAATVLVEEAARNASALTRALGGVPPTSFAFPYGAVSDEAKGTLGPRYASCRGIQPGLNALPAELTELKANKIYDGEFDPACVRELVDEARSTGAWLIFYTHDVSETPSPWGCRPFQLEQAVAYAVKRCTVLPVGVVLRQTSVT